MAENIYFRYCKKSMGTVFVVLQKELHGSTIPPPSEISQDFKNKMFKGVADNLFFIYPIENYICDENGNILVDFVARFENLQEDIAYIAERINFPQLEKAYKDGKPTPSKYHYSEYYDNELRDLVAEIAKWEIEKFNYSFDTKIG